MTQLYELLAGYSDPKVYFAGPIPLGETGLTVRIRYIALLEAAYRSLGRSQAFGFGRKHFPLVFPFQMETIREAWQSEIMRVMDQPRFRNLENLTIQLFHEKFQLEPSIEQFKKDEERRRYELLIERYNRDGYAEFRNKSGFHIDKNEALKEPKPGGNLHDITALILDWFKYAATIVINDEPRFVTIGGPQTGRELAKEFKKMMVSTKRYQRLRRNQRIPSLQRSK